MIIILMTLQKAAVTLVSAMELLQSSAKPLILGDEATEYKNIDIENIMKTNSELHPGCPVSELFFEIHTCNHQWWTDDCRFWYYTTSVTIPYLYICSCHLKYLHDFKRYLHASLHWRPPCWQYAPVSRGRSHWSTSSNPPLDWPKTSYGSKS